MSTKINKIAVPQAKPAYKPIPMTSTLLKGLAEKDADAYYALADHYSGKNAKQERKYLRLAAVAEKRGRETLRRDVRRFKAAKRGTILAGHFSRQRRNAVGIAEFVRVHNDIASCLAERRHQNGRANRRAA